MSDVHRLVAPALAWAFEDSERERLCEVSRQPGDVLRLTLRETIGEKTYASGLEVCLRIPLGEGAQHEVDMFVLHTRDQFAKVKT